MPEIISYAGGGGGAGATGFVQGGNSFGATAILGTNDAFNLEFETSGVSRYRIDTSGNLVMLGNVNFTPLVDSQGSVGTNALRFSLVRAVTVDAG